MEIKFGKYKGKTLEEIYKEDPEYIDWLAHPKPGGFKPFPQVIDAARNLLEATPEPVEPQETAFDFETPKVFNKDVVLQEIDALRQRISEM